MTTWDHGPVGFVGLGNMGQPMVGHLLRSGLDVRVCDLSPEKVDIATKAGATAVGDVAHLVTQCSVIAMSLPDPPAVEAVAGQILAAPARGLTLVDLTTSDPKVSQELEQRARQAGVGFVDAPVSGGPVRSADGTLTIMVGGEPTAVESAMPLLEVLGDHIVHVGGPGMGNVAKLVNNMTILSTIATLSEALVLAQEAGVDLARMVELMSSGTANSYALARTSPKMLSGDYSPGMTLTLAMKDIGLANKLGDDLGLPLRAAAMTRDLLATGLDAGFADQDVSCMFEAVKLAHGMRAAN